VSALIIRMIAAAVMAVGFLMQARRASARSSRQFAFSLGGAAFAVFALSNGLTALGFDGQVVQAASVLGIMLIGLSLFMMVRSYTSGEMSDKLRRAREMVAEERARTKERP
jgi:hypothetical protein